MHFPNKTVIIIAGPTAVGKTAVGIALAKHFNTEIISADSRQCYQELSIGVARPSPEEMAQVPHHFIASHSVEQKLTAADFEAFALARAADILSRNNTVVMVGGTGLYIKAFTEGLDAIPEVSSAVRNAVLMGYQTNGLEWLQKEVKSLDQLFWSRCETQNPQRLMRALEVVQSTGQSILQFQKGEKKLRDFGIVKIGIHLPRETLHHRINTRVETMMQMGLLDEVKSLLPHRHLNALQTVGYKELFEYLNGSYSLTQAIGNIKTHTRQYAKRQLTWFKKDEQFHWLPPDAEAVIQAVGASLGR